MRECIGEEVLVSGAFVKGYALTLATISTKAVVGAIFAFLFNAHAFFNECFCLGIVF